MRSALLFTACASIALVGCASDLAIRKINPGDTATGYPYRLRFTQFEIPVTWRVIACDSTVPNPLKFKIMADAQDKAPLDPDQYYIIDPRPLQGLFRTTEFNMEWYDDRGSKSINSSVDDQTGTAIVSALTAVAKIAGAGLLPFGGERAQCPQPLVDALNAINGVGGADGQEAITKKAQKAVEAQTLVVNRLTARAAAAGAAVDDQTRADLGQAQRLLEALNATLTSEQAKLKGLLEIVSDTRTVTWPTNGAEFQSASTDPVRPSAGAVKRWALASTSQGVDIFFALLPTDGRPLPAGAPASDGSQENEGGEPAAIPGVPYREPRPMRLYICPGAPCGTDASAIEAGGELVKAVDAQVLQAGSLLYLPFRARTFANIKNSAAFSQVGVLTSAGSNQIRGAGTGAVDAAKGAAEQVAAIVEADRTAETARLQARAEEAKARKALSDAEAALLPGADADKLAAIQAFQTDATLASAERAKIEAGAALAAARAQQSQ